MQYRASHSKPPVFPLYRITISDINSYIFECIVVVIYFGPVYDPSPAPIGRRSGEGTCSRVYQCKILSLSWSAGGYDPRRLTAKAYTTRFH
jgi:hypothetical protein